ncbi:hypothetical protein Leryth_008711 [Lithospermum erythrorhizon]|nr:hypothetical protein Leryth_008711 [Lithospermum erythrorhizon]
MSFPVQNNPRGDNNGYRRRPRTNAVVQSTRSEWVPRNSVANDTTNAVVANGSNVGLDGANRVDHVGLLPVQQVNNNRVHRGNSSSRGNQRQENVKLEQQVNRNAVHHGGSSSSGNQGQENGRVEQQVNRNRRYGGFPGQGAGNRFVNQRRERETDKEKGRAVKGNGDGGRVIKEEDQNLPPLVQEIQEKLMTSSIECMICYDMVRRSAPIWSCSSCFSIFHLSCIKKWARAPSSVDMSAEKNQGFNWRCPGCQSVQLTSFKDIRYLCFCGKRQDPSFDLYLTPHSCGEPCGKPLEKILVQPGVNNEDLCPHVCVLQCHPGPCPPCKAFAPPKKCPCGKKTINTRCSDRKQLVTCGGQCGELLDCGRHRCQETCHVGPCSPCQVSVNASCFCKKKTEVILCGDMAVKGEVKIEDGVFSCNSICEKELSCENHKCPDTCHPGPCGECGLLPNKIMTCCCGKTSLKEVRQSCLDPIPTCSEICNKSLPCKVHTCQEVCHSGGCAPCHVFVTQKCLCGSTSRTVECFKTAAENEKFTCDRPCGQKKSCGRHRCSERCCPLSNPRNQFSGNSDPHFCSIHCGKKLRCGNHFCELYCHSGHCPPCLETSFTDLTCACGKTSIPPPLPCGTPPPSCQLPCSVPQPCGHLPSHSCHFGDCPPCTVPIAKECIGGHVVLRNIPCGSKDIKCNKLCGKLRQCGLHACARICHPAPCDSSAGSSREGNTSCGQICGAPRRECRHTCAALCHPGMSCPVARCEFSVTITCSCGRISAAVPCDAGGSSSHNIDTTFEALVVQKLPVALQPVEANGKRVPLGQRKLICDDVCANVERKKNLADAFGISTPNLAELHFGENAVVSEVLSDLLRRDPKWVLSVEERCKYLVLGRGRGGVTALKAHVFCPMLKEKRDAVRFIAERWKLSVNAAGWEPKRFVIVHVTPKSKAPARVLGVKVGSSSNMVQPPMFDPLVDMDPRLVVTLFDLPRDANISALVLRFGGECELVWLNDKNALTVFSDPARAATAMRRLDQGSVYHGAAVLPNSTSAMVSSSGGNPWGASGVVKDANAVEAHKVKPWKKGVASEAEWAGDSPWNSAEWIGNEFDVEPSVWKGKEVPVTSTNQWNVLDRETTSSSASASEKSGYREKPLGVASGESEPGSSGSSLQKDVKNGENADVVDDWEKAFD